MTQGVHRLVAWWDDEVHTAPFNCGDEERGCGAAIYTYVMCACGKVFPIEQFGNTSSNFACEFTSAEMAEVEEHIGCKVEEIDRSALPYMTGRGHALHGEEEDVEWTPSGPGRTRQQMSDQLWTAVGKKLFGAP